MEAESTFTCLNSSSSSATSSTSSPMSCGTYEANSSWSSDWLQWSSASSEGGPAESFEQPHRVEEQPTTENYWVPNAEMAYSSHVQQQYYYMEQDNAAVMTGSQQYAYEYNPWLFSYFDTRYVYEYNSCQSSYAVPGATHYPQQYYVMQATNAGTEEFQAAGRSTETDFGTVDPSPSFPQAEQHPDLNCWTEEMHHGQPDAELGRPDPHQQQEEGEEEEEHLQQETDHDFPTPESSQTKSEPSLAESESLVANSKDEAESMADEAIHQCSNCSRYCVSAGGLKRHARFCPSSESVPQAPEQQHSTDESSLQDRSRSSSGTPASSSGTSSKVEKRSPRRKLGLKQHVCSICSVAVSSERALLEHLASHGVRKAYSCIHCHSQFSRKFHLTRHVKQRGCDGRPRVFFPCQYCQKTFSRKDNLREHLKNHTGQSRQRPKIACPVSGCTKSFQGKTQLQSHLNGHSGVRPYPCSSCDKSFRSAAALRKHGRQHRPFTCAVCQARFASKETLQLHFQTHKESNPVNGTPGPDLVQQQQQQQQLLRKAAQMIRGLNQEEPKAGPSTSSSSSMPSRASKSLHCLDCSKRFYSAEALQLHRVVHSVGGSRLACTHCPRSFVHPSGLIRHNSQRHGYTQQQAEQQLLSQVAAVEQLEKNIMDLLNLLVEPQALLELGWPRARAGVLLESVLVKCGQQPVATGDGYLQRMRANTKMLFNCIVDDYAAVENLLQSCEVNDILEQVINLAKNNQDIVI